MIGTRTVLGAAAALFALGVGTGVAWTGPGESTPQVMWIFDSKTHILLGSPSYSVVTPPHIVDKAGQRP